MILAATYANMLHARITALGRFSEATPEMYRFARSQLRAANEGYRAAQPHLAGQPSLSRIAGRRDLNQQFNQACRDLTTIVGLFLVAADKVPPPRTDT